MDNRRHDPSMKQLVLSSERALVEKSHQPLTQNSIFNINWSCRGASALKMRPKFGVNAIRFGASKLGRLNKLNASTRNFNRARSPRLVSFCSEKSTPL